MASETPVPSWSATGGRARLFSGHESFAFRYGWLPKLYEAVGEDPGLFGSDERAILRLGLGRNMVKSIRFWGEALGLLAFEGGRAVNTRFARMLLDQEDGLDPFLEDGGSLWRLHWRLTAHAGLGAWIIAFLEIHEAEVTRERLVELVRGRALTARGAITEGTAASHVDILLRTYDAARSEDARGVVEESLGCPLQELRLLTVATRNGASTIRLDRGARPDLDVGAFAYGLHDLWAGSAPGSRTLSLRSMMLERRGPATIFRLDEASLLGRLEALCVAAPGIELREDGAGGLDMVGRRDTLQSLEELAWQPR